jgi:hypothetical protein
VTSVAAVTVAGTILALVMAAAALTFPPMRSPA